MRDPQNPKIPNEDSPIEDLIRITDRWEVEASHFKKFKLREVGQQMFLAEYNSQVLKRYKAEKRRAVNWARLVRRGSSIVRVGRKYFRVTVEPVKCEVKR